MKRRTLVSEARHKSLLERRPIPLSLPSVYGWQGVPIRECGEPLVALGALSEYGTVFTDAIYAGERTDSPYFGEGLRGSLLTIFVRRAVALALKRAQQLLPRDMRLVIFDGYRTFETQEVLYSFYLDALRRQECGWTEQQLFVEAQKYVSAPSSHTGDPAPHTTGGAVDLAVFELPGPASRRLEAIDNRLALADGSAHQENYSLDLDRVAIISEYARLLDFGTPLDYSGKEAALAYFECLSLKRALTAKERIAQLNRRLLYHVMTCAGFEAYENEWWHYNSRKSQMGAKADDLPFAEYGPATLSQANKVHESTRRNAQPSLDRTTISFPPASVLAPPGS